MDGWDLKNYILITIDKAIDARPKLRSKKQLIESFIVSVNEYR
ncbi:hypothetical protein [Acetobacterium sp. UBA5834]